MTDETSSSLLSCSFSSLRFGAFATGCVTAPAPQVEVRDTVGAGDAFMAGLMVGLTNEMEPEAVLRNACRLGAFVASHNGATPLLPNELIEPFRKQD